MAIPGTLRPCTPRPGTTRPRTSHSTITAESNFQSHLCCRTNVITGLEAMVETSEGNPSKSSSMDSFLDSLAHTQPGGVMSTLFIFRQTQFSFSFFPFSLPLSLPHPYKCSTFSSRLLAHISFLPLFISFRTLVWFGSLYFLTILHLIVPAVSIWWLAHN